MAFSSLVYTADGVAVDYNVTFDYLDRTHVAVLVDNVRTTEIGSDYSFSWVNPTTVRVGTVLNTNPVPAGLEVKIVRETPINQPAVLFGGGASLSSENLNKNSRYLTYALQEATDANDAFTTLYLGAKSTAPTVDNAGGVLQVGAIYFDTTDDTPYFWTGSVWTRVADAAITAAVAAQAAAELAETNAAASEAAAVSAAGAASTSETNAAASEAAAAASVASISPATIVRTTNNLSDLANAATARTNLGLVIGTDVQAYDAATAKLNVAQSFTAAQRGATQVASITGATVLNFNTNQNFVLTLTGNVTLDNPTTEVVGQSGFIVFVQDATGGRTVSLGTDYETAAGAGLTLSAAANATDIVPYIVVADGRILLGSPQLAFA